jgi:hypothetical protein
MVNSVSAGFRADVEDFDFGSLDDASAWSRSEKAPDAAPAAETVGDAPPPMLRR